MTYTNFPNGITSMGVPTIGTGGLLPFTGNYFFVNETTGSDGNTGGAQDPFATLTRALALCTSGNNDVVFLTGTVHVTATVAWSKNNTHLIGLAGPIQTNQRARISSSGSTVFTPMVSVTGRGCIFLNIGAFHGYADASTQICWAETGGNNYYGQVSFLGMANATAAAQAGSRSLTVGSAGSGENTFMNCQIGLDTVTRSAANYSLEFLGGSPRNTFRNCIFPSFASATSPAFINVGSGAIDRFQVFDNCYFINEIKSGGSSTLAQAFNVSGSAGGLLFLNNCGVYGITAQETSASGNIIGNNPAPAAATSGKSIATTW